MGANPRRCHESVWIIGGLAALALAACSTGAGSATGSGEAGAGGASVTCGGSLPTSGGTSHSGDSQGTAAGLNWSLWMNGSGGSITTYGVPAFGATWTSQSGDYLARTGLEWQGKSYSSLGTVTAEFDETKSQGSSGGGYSYIGVYGWATGATTSQNPSGCVEWYIVDDSYNELPVNPGNTTMQGSATIDGGAYILYTRPTTGTGGSRCGAGVNSWMQYYSVRMTARTCGTISISQHWAAWNGTNNMPPGNPLEASVLVEVGGGSGSISFATSNVTAQ